MDPTPVVISLLTMIIPKLYTFVSGQYNLEETVRQDVQSIKNELDMMLSAIQDYSSSSSKDHHHHHQPVRVQATWIDKVRALAHQMEDCIDSYIYDQIAHGSGRISWQGPARFASKIKELRSRSAELSKLNHQYHHGAPASAFSFRRDNNNNNNISTSGKNSRSNLLAAAPPPDHSGDHHHKLIVGMEDRRRELLELVVDGEEQRRVISIVGFGGQGKTALANQVYREVVDGEQQRYCSFSPRVWVSAAEKTAEEVVREIVKRFEEEQAGIDMSDVDQLCMRLREHLRNKRYLIVIDDMRTEQWCNIEPAFPVDHGVSSRIVVTTSVQSIANACSIPKGYIYKMEKLDAECSKDLFFRSASVEECSPDMERGSEPLRKKCDGLPLALICVGQFLRTQGTLTGHTCKDICNKLGYHLENKDNNALARMQGLLARNYTSLDDDAKACLLYLGMFPSHHPIKRERLLMRWLAEGLVRKKPHRRLGDAAVNNFNMFMDRNIFQAVNVSTNDGVKTCQMPGMMLEFIMHRSISEGFITLVSDENEMMPQVADYNVPRHLSVQLRMAAAAAKDRPLGSRNDFSLVRSLMVSGIASHYVLDFSKYKLLKVLDLEECDGLMDQHLQGICNLLLLKYLSLGGQVTMLPKKIETLSFLETLDVRRTKVEVMVIPVEAIVLPKLIHLFGKFKLSGKLSDKVHKFFETGKGNLHTLAGFVTDSKQSFVEIIGHMKNLRKVKIWCKSDPDGSNMSSLSSAIQSYIEDGDDLNDTRSLSVDFNECSEDIMNFSLQGACNLCTLKLQGDLQQMPPFVSSLLALRELCLTSTTHRQELLTSLTELSCLVYLKLVAQNHEDFIIKTGTFQSLQRLCIVVQNPLLLEIHDGALPQLVSLQLMYESLANLPLINIGCIKRLREVVLDSVVNQKSRKCWEDAARKHTNRPKISFIRRTRRTRPEHSAEPVERPTAQNRNWLQNGIRSLFGRN